MMSVTTIESNYFYLSIVLSALAFFSTAALDKEKANKGYVLEFGNIQLACSLLLILCLGFFRFYNCSYAFAGIFTPADENNMSRIYTGAILSLRPVASGATHLIPALFYGVWYQLVGCCNVVTTRMLSPLIGTCGVILSYLVVKREFGKTCAILATILFSFSTYLSLFSSLALETVYSFFFIPLCLFLFSQKEKSRSFVWAGLSGLALACSFFSYPGVIMFFAVFFFCCFALLPRKFLSICARRDTIFSIFIFAASASVLFYLHKSVYSLSPSSIAVSADGSFTGAGGLPERAWQVLDSLFTTLLDLFAGGNSLYFRLLPRGTFLEPALWGFFILGIYFGLHRKDWRLKVLAASCLVTIICNVGITLEPGMRRGICILPILYLFCAIGFLEFWRVLSSKRILAYGTAGAIFCCLAVNFFYVIPSHIAPVWLGKTPPVPEEVLLASLKRGDVFLDPDNFEFDTSGLDAQASVGLADLWKKFNPSKGVGKVILFKENQTPAPETLCGTYFFWENFGKKLPDHFWEKNGFTITGESSKVFFQDKILHSVRLLKDPQKLPCSP